MSKINFSSKTLLTRLLGFANIRKHNCPVRRGFFYFKGTMQNNQTIATSRKVALTITLPSINFSALLKKAGVTFSELFSSVYTPISNGFSNASEVTSSRARRMKFPRMRKVGFDKKYLKFIIPVVLGILVIAAIGSLAKSLPDAKSKPVNSNSQLSMPSVLDTVNLERKFSFPLKNEKGVSVGNFDYVIQSATIQKQIIVQGQRATAVAGRDFLILNLKITNNLKQTIQLSTRDYLRLIVASNPSEQLAPDIHNDPAEVQAISTKYTKVGIAIDEADAKKTIHLKVGEIDGAKQNIDLNFNF